MADKTEIPVGISECPKMKDSLCYVSRNSQNAELFRAFAFSLPIAVSYRFSLAVEVYYVDANKTAAKSRPISKREKNT